MRHMVHFQVTVEQGLKIEAAGGPGKLIGYVAETYRPEQIYFCTTRREGWMFVDVDQQKATELMAILTRMTGSYPEIVPVLTAQEFAPYIGKVLSAVEKAPKL